MHTKTILRSATAASLICSAVFLSCDEKLPPYEPPQNVLSAKLSILEAGTVTYVKCPSLGWSVPAVVFKISVTNNYNETLQAPAVGVSGELEVWRKETPEFGQKIAIKGATDPRHVQNGMLTLGPGETLEIAVEWYHTDEQNRRIWKVFQERPFQATIRARVRIKVFSDTPILTPPETETKVTYDVDTSVAMCNQ